MKVAFLGSVKFLRDDFSVKFRGYFLLKFCMSAFATNNS